MPENQAEPFDDPLDLIGQLLQAQAELATRVDALEKQLGDETDAGEPEDLDQWVEWLIDTYALQRVLDQWRSQPGIVRELAALMKAHIDVIGKRKGFDDVVWHGHLASMVTRIEAFRLRATKDRQAAATQGSALAKLRSTPA